MNLTGLYQTPIHCVVEATARGRALRVPVGVASWWVLPARSARRGGALLPVTPRLLRQDHREPPARATIRSRPGATAGATQQSGHLHGRGAASRPGSQRRGGRLPGGVSWSCLGHCMLITPLRRTHGVEWAFLESSSRSWPPARRSCPPDQLPTRHVGPHDTLQEAYQAINSVLCRPLRASGPPWDSYVPTPTKNMTPPG